MLFRAAAAGLFLATLSLTVYALDPAETRTTVFQVNTGEYVITRIPSLVTALDGTVLAFAEGRRDDSDHGRNDIILRRSTDRGATWGDTIFIRVSPDWVYVNPCAVVLDSGRILLMYQSFPVGYHARVIPGRSQLLEPGYDEGKISQTWLQYSDDSGATWSEPRDISRGTKRPAPVISTASGPGIGIVLRQEPNKGRIVIPTNQCWWEGDQRIFDVYTCYSDDNGETWAYGELAARSEGIMGDECQVVERTDGALLLNVRTFMDNHRLVAASTDAGATWSPLAIDSELPEPRCQASILRYSWPEEGKSRILFSNPATDVHDDRTHGTVRVSYDEGKTWPVSKLLVEGEFAYSCLTRLDDGTIGILCETEHYQKIDFLRFSIDWLEGE